MRTLALVSLSLFVVSCGAPQPTCSPESCGGCCAADGRCEGGGTVTACGAGGLVCRACAATQLCVSGACVDQASGGGGGATGGGGGDDAGSGGGGGTTGGGGGATGGGGGDDAGSGGGGGTTGGGGGATGGGGGDDAGSGGGGGGATGGGGGTADGGGTVDAGPGDGGLRFQGPFCETNADGGRWCWESPGPGLQPWGGVFSLSDTEVFVVGENGSIVAWLDGTWRQLREGDGRGLNDVWASSRQDIWAVGKGGLVLRGSVGGGFAQVALNSTSELLGVFGFSSSDVWAVGSGGTIAHWDGQAFATVSSPATATLQDVWGAAPNAVWAVGNSGTIVRYNGIGWSLVTQPAGNNSAFFTAVAGTSTSELVIAGRFAYQWNGSTFTAMPTLPGAAQVNALEPANGGYWAALRDDGLYFWDGLGWSAVTTGAQAILTGMSGRVVVGAQGELLLREGTAVRRLMSVRESVVAIGGNDPAALVAIGSSGTLWSRGPTGWSATDAGIPPGVRAVVRTSDGLVLVAFADGGVGSFSNGLYSPEAPPFAAASVHATGARAWVAAPGSLAWRSAAGGWQTWSSADLLSPTATCETFDGTGLWAYGTFVSGFPPTTGIARIDADGGVSGKVLSSSGWEQCVPVDAASAVWSRRYFSDRELARVVNGVASAPVTEFAAAATFAGTTKGAIRLLTTDSASVPVTWSTTVKAPSPDGGVLGPVTEPVPLGQVRLQAVRCLGTTCWFAGDRGAILRREW